MVQLQHLVRGLTERMWPGCGQELIELRPRYIRRAKISGFDRFDRRGEEGFATVGDCDARERDDREDSTQENLSGRSMKHKII